MDAMSYVVFPFGFQPRQNCLKKSLATLCELVRGGIIFALVLLSIGVSTDFSYSQNLKFARRAPPLDKHGRCTPSRETSRENNPTIIAIV